MFPKFNIYQLFALIFMVLTIAIGGCSSRAAQPPASTLTTQPTPPALPTPTAESVTATPPLLHYQGPAEMGSLDESRCATLQVDDAVSALLSGCDGTTAATEMGEGAANDLVAFQERMAPFVYETATETLTFNGNGTAQNAAWLRAMLAWARARHDHPIHRRGTSGDSALCAEPLESTGRITDGVGCQRVARQFH